MKDKDVIKKYLGLPFKHQGRNVTEGFDCWGLIKAVYADAGIQLFDLESYEVNWAKGGKNYFLENYSEQWQKVENPQFMDVVLFKTSDLAVNHAGLILNDSRFIHAGKAGVVVSRLGELNTFKKIVGFYRFRHDQDQIFSE